MERLHHIVLPLSEEPEATVEPDGPAIDSEYLHPMFETEPIPMDKREPVRPPPQEHPQTTPRPARSPGRVSPPVHPNPNQRPVNPEKDRPFVPPQRTEIIVPNGPEQRVYSAIGSLALPERAA